VHVGLGASSAVQSVIVQWPDGLRERWTDVSADRLVTLKRGSSEEKEQKELPARRQ
jgi:hypothetical protein